MDHFINIPGITTPILTFCIKESRDFMAHRVHTGEMTREAATLKLGAMMGGFMCQKANSDIAKASGLAIGASVIVVERDVYKELNGPELVHMVAHEEGHVLRGHLVDCDGENVIINQGMEFEADDTACLLVGDRGVYKQSFLNMIPAAYKVTGRKIGVPEEMIDQNIQALMTDASIVERLARL